MRATPSGILLVDKPSGLTSHDVVARVRRLASTRKVGHAGTLDPMATGLLVLGIGSATRLLTYIVGADKEYFATVRLGAATTTDDAEGEFVSSAPQGAVARLSEASIRTALVGLSGDIMQVPSAVSAIKVGGRRAYTMVRAGETPELAARAVTVKAFELLATRVNDASGTLDADVRVVCSSGTYVRALARDLGAGLGVGGHLTALRRTRVGAFSVADAFELDGLDVHARLHTSAAAASLLFPVWSLDESRAVDLGHGKRLDASDAPPGGGPIAAIAPDGRLIGLVELRDGESRVLANFPADTPRDDGNETSGGRA